MPVTYRQYYRPTKGRQAFNFNAPEIGHDSSVLVTASECGSDGARFVGAASIAVENISPHGPPYDLNHGVTFMINVDSRDPLPVVADITVLGGIDIAFNMQPQQRTNWCWAATATSVVAYYTPTAWTQCSLANAELGRADCCTNPSDPCNVEHPLDGPLTRLGCLDSLVSRQATYAEISREINAGRPLCIHIGWRGGGGHFIAVTGYDDFPGWVYIDDSWFGPSDIADATVRSAYQGSGTWTHSYFTRHP
ncbi:C39 family peptidase [Streptomyces sp. NPDC002520]